MRPMARPILSGRLGPVPRAIWSASLANAASLARALLNLASQIRNQIMAVEVDLIGHVADGVALQQLVFNVGIAGHRSECRQPVMMGDHLVGHGARLDLARPSHHAWHPKGPLPISVLLVTERRHR